MSDRNTSIDVLRGALLVLMTMTHLPTIWSGFFGEPLGFISAAEGFVFLSAFMAGKIFTQYQGRDGVSAASRWMWGRALRIYSLHMLLLLLAFTVFAWIALRFHRPAVTNLLDYYFHSPRNAVVSGAMLIYQPALLDILPMYVLFCVLTPVLMRCAARWGWSRVIAASAVVWVAAQFGLRRALHDFFARNLGWDMPMNAMGAFDILAWQFLWVLGLWFGALGFGKTQAVVLSGRKVL
ncbi:MAG TPA: OpgC domain-containing protein, partial [Steroidobacteraceae bacterium]|nr:OpgC domain-containing protein [Steroidobacteraceae bacterium]